MDIYFKIKKLKEHESYDESGDNWEYLSLLEDFFVGETWHPIDYYDLSSLIQITKEDYLKGRLYI